MHYDTIQYNKIYLCRIHKIVIIIIICLIHESSIRTITRQPVVILSYAVLCQIVSLQYLSRSSLHRLAGLPCRLFLSYSLQVVTREVHRSGVFEAVDVPCPGPFHFSHSVDYIYDFCLLPDPNVGLSIFVCDVEHTSLHFGLCSRKFVLCLFGQCPGH